MEIVEFSVTRRNRRLDKFLADNMDLSRSHIQKIIDAGGVLVDGMEARSSSSLEPGSLVKVTIPDDILSEFIPEDLPIEILFQDKDLAVIVKPAGMASHPYGNQMTGTLANALLFHVRDLSGINGVLRPGIVHRLDKGTSGVMLIAKNDRAHQELSGQFATRVVKKTYAAICRGVLSETVGIIEVPIGRSRQDRMKMEATGINGKEAVTRFRVSERFGRHTLVRCFPETGRTHQIRVHLAYIGYPVAGDGVYGTREVENLGLEQGRQLLHAEEISFRHPCTGETMTFKALFPSDFEAVLASLRKGD